MDDHDEAGVPNIPCYDTMENTYMAGVIGMTIIKVQIQISIIIGCYVRNLYPEPRHLIAIIPLFNLNVTLGFAIIFCNGYLKGVRPKFIKDEA
uniref:Uncharacterized protein n=1 Tax=viral metagenome TaxID=1070528 RepID=A0A6M3ME17_9ZZZZ